MVSPRRRFGSGGQFGSGEEPARRIAAGDLDDHVQVECRSLLGSDSWPAMAFGLKHAEHLIALALIDGRG